ncbi:MAG: sigma 54-interacting transcriptional regulator [Myxococcales bacterium]|nr:sigma 54-interacting transcriptional regulator [Myxococcales bacterium]
MTTPKGKYPIRERRYPSGGSAPDGRHPEARSTRAPPAAGSLLGQEETIRRLAPSRATVLLLGGSADAKALAARALHDRSPRAHHPFAAVDCSGLPPADLEEALFGEGPFGRSPVRDRPLPDGAIQRAEHGTLHVAAVDALPLGLQPRFLRFLDEPRAVRVVASCDVDLATLTRRGAFRADLGERLALVCVHLSSEAAV